MTLEEIKKAFNICHNTPSCTGCPMLKLEKQNGHGCKHSLFISAIGLITEQEKEIEELKKNMKSTLEFQKKQLVKEFAEKLKQKARGLTLEGDKGPGFYIGNVVLTNDIDKLLKEYEK